MVDKLISGPDGQMLAALPRQDIRGMGEIYEVRCGRERPRFYRLERPGGVALGARDVTPEVTALLLDRLARAEKRADQRQRRDRRRLRQARHMCPADWQRKNDAVTLAQCHDGGRASGAGGPKRLRSDVLERLHRRGRLTLAQLQAGEELRHAWRVLTRGLYMSARRLERVQVEGRRRFEDPVGRMSHRDAARVKRYRRWAAAAAEKRLPARHAPNLTLLQLALDLVVDNLGPSQLERCHGMRNGTATDRLVEALELYQKVSD